ncbi:MAG: NuoM family protein [Gaiellales bacterium]
MTVALILIPLAAALIVAVLPLPRRSTEALALGAALAELALGVVALIRFDTTKGVQFATDRLWFGDLVSKADARFSVGISGLSLFMVLLTALGVFSAIATAAWIGRARPRAYFSLLLMLEGALVLLFTARDLVLFYTGWEAMMIPLYVLIGVWGGRERRRATFTFFVYTLVGSLLMLVGVAWVGITQGTFELDALQNAGITDAGPFFLFAAAFCIKAPIFPLHGWLPLTYRESPIEVTALLSGVISKAGAYGLLAWALPLFKPVAEDYQWWFAGLALAGLVYGSLVAFRAPDARGVIAYSSLGQMNLIVIGIFALNADGFTGATFQMVNHGVASLAAFLLIGLVELRTGTDLFRWLGGLANRRAALSTVFLFATMFALAVPGSSTFVSELYILLGAFRFEPWLGAAAATGIVLAAMYMLRWYSGIAHETEGERVDPATPDLRPYELGIAVPLVLVLLAMSAWPSGVMERIVS